MNYSRKYVETLNKDNSFIENNLEKVVWVLWHILIITMFFISSIATGLLHWNCLVFDDQQYYVYEQNLFKLYLIKSIISCFVILICSSLLMVATPSLL